MKCMCAVVGVGDGADVGEQLLAAADVPAILTLIDRDDDRRLGGGKPGDGVDGGRIDVRGSDHGLASPLGTLGAVADPVVRTRRGRA